MRHLFAALAALALTACPNTYTVDSQTTLIDPMGDAGIKTSVLVDDATEPLVTVQSPKAKLSVHKAVAKRICAVFPECAWDEESGGE